MLSGICKGKPADIHDVNLINFFQKISEEEIHIA